MFTVPVATCNKLLAHEVHALRKCRASSEFFHGQIFSAVEFACSTHLSNIASLRLQIRIMGGKPDTCSAMHEGTEDSPCSIGEIITTESQCISRHLGALEVQEISSDVRNLIRFTLIPDLKFCIQNLRHATRPLRFELTRMMELDLADECLPSFPLPLPQSA